MNKEVLILKTIGKRLAYTRLNILNMNQKDFADLIGVSQGALSQIENDKRGISMEAIIELMKYSKTNKNISCLWILTGIKDEIVTSDEKKLNENELELLSFFKLLPEREQIKWIARIEDATKQYITNSEGGEYKGKIS